MKTKYQITQVDRADTPIAWWDGSKCGLSTDSKRAITIDNLGLAVRVIQILRARLPNAKLVTRPIRRVP